MRAISTGDGRATLELTYDELAILYGGLVEASEALSPSEFRARIGRSETDAEALRSVLKPIVIALEGREPGDATG